MKNEPFYITTPIYYVNDIPHLGTAYCTLAADVLARYERLRGRDVKFLTGTDEHGEKIQEAAKKNSKNPQAFTDEVSTVFRHVWEKLNITDDDFIRTTEARHKEVVVKLLEKSMANGDIYLGDYEGWYCIPDESFWTSSQLKDGRCPTCGREVKKIKEENYFFKLTKYIPALLKHIEANPEFIMPESKKNEVLGFLREEIRDISISRTSFTWGIPFPKGNTQPTQNHVVYVWFDALPNYVSALKPFSESSSMNKYWGTESHPRAIHLVGKDILRFHAVYWPCFLMSVGLPLPKRIFAHGWWTIEGQKMSKSLGNVVDPVAFSKEYGLDAFRLFLFREFPMGQDGDFSLKSFKERVNADLANNLGNLVNRTLTLITKNMNSQIFDKPHFGKEDSDIGPLIISNFELARIQYLGRNPADTRQAFESMEKFNFHSVLTSIFGVLSATNKYLEIKAPWSLAKDPSRHEEMTQVLTAAAEALRVCSIMLWPFIPSTADEILRRLGQPPMAELVKASHLDGGIALESTLSWGRGKSAQVSMGQPLFMRLT